MREVREISIEQIHPNRHQPRLEFNEDALMELAQSIRENGLIQPITVREDEDGYEIIAGERRYKACILAGYSEVPCNVMSADEQKLAELALVENIQRENLTSIEEAKAYIQIMRSAGMTQEELASKMGKSQSTIANKVRLLNLPDEIQEGISSRKITERHARALLSVVYTSGLSGRSILFYTKQCCHQRRGNRTKNNRKRTDRLNQLASVLV